MPVVSISAFSMYGIMNTGFSTIGKPKKIGSLIWNTCVGSDSRPIWRNDGSFDRHRINARAIVAPVPPTLTNVVKKPLAVTYGSGWPAFMRRDVGREILQKNRRHDRVHRIVAIDPHRPQHRHQARIDEDARQRVQREYQRRERGADQRIDIDAQHEPDRPEEQDEKQSAASATRTTDTRPAARSRACGSPRSSRRTASARGPTTIAARIAVKRPCEPRPSMSSASVVASICSSRNDDERHRRR